MISKKSRKIFCSFLLAGLIVSQMTVGNVFALSESGTSIEARIEVGTPGGQANLGRGSAEITIAGNMNQTLVGKKFHI